MLKDLTDADLELPEIISEPGIASVILARSDAHSVVNVRGSQQRFRYHLAVRNGEIAERRFPQFDHKAATIPVELKGQKLEMMSTSPLKVRHLAGESVLKQPRYDVLLQRSLHSVAKQDLFVYLDRRRFTRCRDKLA